MTCLPAQPDLTLQQVGGAATSQISYRIQHDRKGGDHDDMLVGLTWPGSVGELPSERWDPHRAPCVPRARPEAVAAESTGSGAHGLGPALR